MPRSACLSAVSTAKTDTGVSPHGHVPGWMTKGILDKDTYYYRGVYLDAVRALEVISGFEEVDETRIAVIGGSQEADFQSPRRHYLTFRERLRPIILI